MMMTAPESANANASADEPHGLRIAFVHPDLGIGGAERLVVDAAAGLQRRGHAVTIYTSHHDQDHCFQETRDGSLDVRVGGDFLPRSFLGYGHILCATLRGLYLAATIALTSPRKYDVIVVDQLSAPIPLLRTTKSKILFYCHFPDKLLTARSSLIKRIYRVPFDFFEELTTMMADEIIVNSQFTASVFSSTFKLIGHTPKVVYPGIHLDSYSGTVELSDALVKVLVSEKKTILSINRFERKKNLGLAIRSFALLKKDAPKESMKYRLVIAGGYDKRVTENVEHLNELQKLADELNLTTQVIKGGELDTNFPSGEEAEVVFVLSFNEAQRTYLLSTTSCLVYTPSEEHFGIVPVEAMYARVPVVAVASGGPMETVVDGETGYLCAADPQEFAQAIRKIMQSSDAGVHTKTKAKSEKAGPPRSSMGAAGHARVVERFSQEAFLDALEGVLARVMVGTNLEAGTTFYMMMFTMCAGIIAITTLTIMAFEHDPKMNH